MSLFVLSARAALASLLVFVGAPANAQDSPLRAVAKSAGFATDPGPPADFVAATRPSGELSPIPVFKTPDEPSSKVKSASELKAMDADLEKAGRSHDAIRAAFPPAAKAMAEAEAARKAKLRKKAHPQAIAPKT